VLAQVRTVMNRSFPIALFYCVLPVLLLLDASHVSAVETVRVSPSSLSLKKGESKTLTLTGKNLKNAKSALVFLKNSPIKEFTTQLTCKAATRCDVALTLQGQIAKGEYSVILLDAKEKPIAQGLIKLSPLSGSKIASSKRTLKSKPKQAPLAEKALPKSSRIPRSSSKQAPPAKKATPQSSRSLKSSSKQAPPAVKAIPQSSRSLRSKPNQAPSQSILPSTPEKIRVNPPTVKLTVGKQQTLTITGNKLGSAKIAIVFLGKVLKKEFQVKPNCNPIGRCTLGLTLKQKLSPGGYTLQLLSAQKKLIAVGQFRVVSVTDPVQLAGVKLVQQKAAPGEIVKGSITLTGKAPSPKGVRVALTSSNSTMAKVQPVQVRAGQTKADFSFKAGPTLGTVTIKAQLGKKTLTAKLVVAQAPFRSVTLNKGTFLMTGRRSTPFSPITINKGAFLMTGRRGESAETPESPFSSPVQGTLEMTGRRSESTTPVIIDPPETIQMTGTRVGSAETPESPFSSPIEGTLEMTGRRSESTTPVIIDPPETIQMTGKRVGSAETPESPFSSPIEGTLEMTGRRSESTTPVIIDPPETIQMTGKRAESVESPDVPPSFTPVDIATEGLEVTGRGLDPFTPVDIATEGLEVTGRGLDPFTPVDIATEGLEVTGRGLDPFIPVDIATEGLEVTGRGSNPFIPVDIATEGLEVTGRGSGPFTPVAITPEGLEATGRRFNPVVITPEGLEATGRRFNPVVITPEGLEATGRRGEPAQNQ
jgi:hypothetical protein